jgi:hypothetical protein
MVPVEKISPTTEEDSQTGDYLQTNLNRIQYTLEESKDSPYKKLFRQEGKGGLKTMLSDKILTFRIRMIPSDEKVIHESFWYFRVELQLFDLPKDQWPAFPKFSEPLEARQWALANRGKVVIGDFFDVVFPDPLNRDFQNFFENEQFNIKRPIGDNVVGNEPAGTNE